MIISGNYRGIIIEGSCQKKSLTREINNNNKNKEILRFAMAEKMPEWKKTLADRLNCDFLLWMR